ncbi:hypothetical protein BH09VER1_BH09VER1_25990 [soil metagenome]
MDSPALVPQIIQTISVFCACVAVIFGIDAWRREFVGKRRIALAEKVLVAFYEARDALARIRHSSGYVGEGAERERRPNESAEESRILDQANVVFVRYNEEREIFNRLRALRYRTVARLGASAIEPFDELDKAIKGVFKAAGLLGTLYWRRDHFRTEDQLERHLREAQKYEAMFWATGDEEDEISRGMNGTIVKVEAICRPIIANPGVGFILVSPLREILKHRRNL